LAVSFFYPLLAVALGKPDHRVISQRHPHTAETLTNGARMLPSVIYPTLWPRGLDLLSRAAFLWRGLAFGLGERLQWIRPVLAHPAASILFKSSAASLVPV
jgi:hypothetical protein